MKKPLAHALVLVAVAFALALVSNAAASRERKLVLPGSYANAPQVRHEIVASAPATTVSPATTTIPATTTRVTQPADVAAANAVTQTTAAAHPSPSANPSREPAAPPKQEVQPAADPLASFAPHPDKPYVEIGGAEAATLHANGALTLDARRTSVYEQGHIAGARPFSVWESDIDDKVNKLYEERNDPREQLRPILVYCSGGDCEDSHMLAQKLWGVQFNNVYVYKDGFPDWQKRGGPIHTGSNP